MSQLTFPLRVIAHVIGVPISDYDRFHRWALDVIGFADDPPKAIAAAEAIVDCVRPIMEQRRARRVRDLPSNLTHAEVDGERLSDEEIVSFLRLLLPAGAETTYRLIGNVLFALLTHPPCLEEVLADRATLDLAIEETLRWESPVQYASRETTAPVTVPGGELPAGAMVQVRELGEEGHHEAHRGVEDRGFDAHPVERPEVRGRVEAVLHLVGECAGLAAERERRRGRQVEDGATRRGPFREHLHRLDHVGVGIENAQRIAHGLPPGPGVSTGASPRGSRRTASGAQTGPCR